MLPRNSPVSDYMEGVEISSWEPFHTALNSSVSAYMTGGEISSPGPPLSLLWSHGIPLSLIKWKVLRYPGGLLHTALNSSVSVYMTGVEISSPGPPLSLPCSHGILLPLFRWKVLRSPAGALPHCPEFLCFYLDDWRWDLQPWSSIVPAMIPWNFPDSD